MTGLFYQTWLVLLCSREHNRVTAVESPEQGNQPLRVVNWVSGAVGYLGVLFSHRQEKWRKARREERGGLGRRDGMRMVEEGTG